ncbi:hypothetical protein C4J85_3086 [Pseudomonas sp. R4-34-07]|nr:hypothetical protein C4J85_3086 [Pseudomonas sp. R4-34-07]
MASEKTVCALTASHPSQHDPGMSLIQMRLTRTTTTTAYGGPCGCCGGFI